MLCRERLQACRDGAGSVVVVSGEAGIGKSRLVEEFLATADGPLHVLSGGCPPVAGSELPYAPVLQALRALRPTLPVGQQALVADWLAPGPLAQDAASRSAQVRFFEGLTEVLLRLAAERPVVFVVEDLHWADRSTVDLLSYLAAAVRTERVLLLLTTRDDLPRDSPHRRVLAELGRLPQTRLLPLSRLDRDDTAALLGHLHGRPPPPEVVDAVFDRAEGNPLFTGLLLPEAGTGGLPRPLRDLLTARFTQLSPGARQLLQVACTVGRHVHDELLSRVSGVPEEDVDAALHELVDRQVLRPEGDGLAFVHELVREAAYDELLPGERRRLHGRLAEALAQVPHRRRDAGRPGAGRGRPPLPGRRPVGRGPPALGGGGAGGAALLRLRRGPRAAAAGRHGLGAARAARPDQPAAPRRPPRSRRPGGGPARRRRAGGAARHPGAGRPRAGRPGRAGGPARALRHLPLQRGGRAVRAGRPADALHLLPADQPSAVRAGVLASLALLSMAWTRLDEAGERARAAIDAARRAGALASRRAGPATRSASRSRPRASSTPGWSSCRPPWRWPGTPTTPTTSVRRPSTSATCSASRAATTRPSRPAWRATRPRRPPVWSASTAASCWPTPRTRCSGPAGGRRPTGCSPRPASGPRAGCGPSPACCRVPAWPAAGAITSWRWPARRRPRPARRPRPGQSRGASSCSRSPRSCAPAPARTRRPPRSTSSARAGRAGRRGAVRGAARRLRGLRAAADEAERADARRGPGRGGRRPRRRRGAARARRSAGPLPARPGLVRAARGRSARRPVRRRARPAARAARPRGLAARPGTGARSSGRTRRPTRAGARPRRCSPGQRGHRAQVPGGARARGRAARGRAALVDELAALPAGSDPAGGPRAGPDRRRPEARLGLTTASWRCSRGSRRRPHQPRDRRRAVHQREDRERARLQHPAQARRRRRQDAARIGRQIGLVRAAARLTPCPYGSEACRGLEVLRGPEPSQAAEVVAASEVAPQTVAPPHVARRAPPTAGRTEPVPARTPTQELTIRPSRCDRNPRRCRASRSRSSARCRVRADSTTATTAWSTNVCSVTVLSLKALNLQEDNEKDEIVPRSRHTKTVERTYTKGKKRYLLDGTGVQMVRRRAAARGPPAREPRAGLGHGAVRQRLRHHHPDRPDRRRHLTRRPARQRSSPEQAERRRRSTRRTCSTRSTTPSRPQPAPLHL